MFATKGYDVYVIDWGNDGITVKVGSTMEDYINSLERCLMFILDEHKVKMCHVFGFCEGSVFAMILAALHPNKMKSLVLNDAIVDTSKAGNIKILIDRLMPYIESYSNKYYSQHFNWHPEVCLGLLDLCMPIPTTRTFHLYGNEYKDDLYHNKLMRALDPREIQGSHHIEHIVKLYKENALYQGTLYFNGRRVDLKAIECPVLNFIGTEDPTTVPAAAYIEDGVMGVQVENFFFKGDHMLFSFSKNFKFIRKYWVDWVQNADKSMNERKHIC
jgi:polyhydroxyalkanoate synthase